MKRKTLSKIISFGLIATLSINIVVSANETYYSQKNYRPVQSLQGYDYVMQYGDIECECKTKVINGEILETDNLYNLNDGLICNLYDDTEIIKTNYINSTTITNEKNLYSTNIYEANANNDGTINLTNMIVAENDISLKAGNINGEKSILYSKKNDIQFDGDNVNYTGIIYAPNGTIYLDGTNITISGVIIAKKIVICADVFTVNHNDEMALLTENIGYTKTDQLMGLTAFYDEEPNEIVLQWKSDKYVSDVDVYARYGNAEKFSKVKKTMDQECRISADTLVDKADYKVVMHTKFCEEIESIIVSMIKDDDSIHTKTIDSDSDGIPDGYELSIGTNPFKADTDEDGFSDGYEINVLFTDSLVYNEDENFDDDSLSNLQEMKLGTNPYLTDSDFDGISDNEDTSPMKTDPDSGRDINYDVPIHTSIFDLVTRYVDDNGNKCEMINNYVTEECKISSIGANKSINVYDKSNKLTTVIEYIDGKVMNVSNYANGNLTSITHNGFQYGLTYNKNGNIINANVNNNMLVNNSYSDENLVTESYGNDTSYEYEYDENENLIAQKLNGKIIYEWEYDDNDNMILYNDILNNISYSYEYDKEGNLISVDSNTGYDIEYNEKTNSYSVAYANGNTTKTQKTVYITADTETPTDVISKSITNLISDGRLINVITSENKEKSTIYSNKNAILNSEYTYTEDKISNIEYQDGKVLKYLYDSEGNISSIIENGEEKANYEYDELNRLVRENSTYANKTVLYTYDNAGNILKADNYKYTNGKLGDIVSTKTYLYQNTEWKDVLTSFNNQDITYDEIGNPLSYRDDMKFTWNERILTSIQKDKSLINYTYNYDGIRIAKDINGIETTYQLDGTKIVSETTNGNIKWYIYDQNDSIIGFEYNDNVYYFEKNAQNDIVRIFDEDGNYISEYLYDSWGNISSILGNEEVANANPFRYRSYYYDIESGLYYLQSRYYDSYTGRFINADNVNQIENGEYNLYIYCSDNPVYYVDTDGNFKYNSTKARDYAYKWAFSHNPNYPNLEKAGGDCANFVSQCLHAGGFPMSFVSYRPWYCEKHPITKKWSYSHSWVLALHLYNYFRVNFGVKLYKVKTAANLKKCASNIKVGDLAFFDWTSNGTINHSTIITKTGGKTDAYYSGHTTARHNKSIKYTLDNKMTVYIVTLKNKYIGLG